jgi:hypothetical protein
VNTIAISCVVFACTVGGVICGAFIRSRVAEHHLNADAKDVVKLATALMATLSALVLGLLIATAKSSFDTKVTQVKQITANVILLDQLLAQYGSEAINARQMARRSINGMVDRIWQEKESKSESANPFEMSREAEDFFQTIFALSLQNNVQRSLQGRIIQTANDLGQARLSLYVQSGDTISIPFLMILVFWLTMIFAILSLLTRLNVLVGLILLFCSLSVSGAIFLILDLDRPFTGVLQIPSAPLRNALAPLSS